MKLLPLVCEEFINMHLIVVRTKGNHCERWKVSSQIEDNYKIIMEVKNMLDVVSNI
jgi:hypothetical protein